jgi:hypothetical protein
MQRTIGLHNLVLVPPPEFSRQMTAHWSGKLDMPIPPTLPPVWIAMAEHFSRSAITNGSGVSTSTSVVLPLPTGSGKTQGTCVYASMQADLNAGTNGQPVGIIIVTRLIEDADAIVAEVNELAGREVAVSDHSKARAIPVNLFNADILVVTHAAFKDAAESFGVEDASKWDRLSQWRGGERLLIIIDEALANVVQSHKVTTQNLSSVLRGIPQELRQQFPNALRCLEILERWLRDREATSEAHTAQELWRDGSTQETLVEVRQLRQAMQGALSDPLFAEEAPCLVDDILQDVERMCAAHAYYLRSGNQSSINGGSYLIPPSLPGAVILDATANHDVLYQLLGDRVYIAPMPDGVRDYSNVTLHVCRTASGLGKHVMDETKHLRLPRLAAHLSEQLSPDRSVFLCCHKHSAALAETFSSDKLKLQVGHWGAVDGKNNWKDCDVAVIWGLPYMDQRRAINSVFATLGPLGTDWLRDNTNKQQPNLVNIIMQRHLSTSVIQAINRIGCRRVIDQLGRCPPCDVFIPLPKGWQGEGVLNDIKLAMPGIRVEPWDYEPDGPKVYAPRSNSANAALLTLMKQREPGLTPFPFITRALSLGDRKVQRIREQLNDATSHLHRALSEIGVSYSHTGKGRGSKTYLLKVA